METRNVVSPSPLSEYRSLTSGGRFQVELPQDEAAAVLKAYDYGLAALDSKERQLVDSVLARLKEAIFP